MLPRPQVHTVSSRCAVPPRAMNLNVVRVNNESLQRPHERFLRRFTFLARDPETPCMLEVMRNSVRIDQDRPASGTGIVNQDRSLARQHIVRVGVGDGEAADCGVDGPSGDGGDLDVRCPATGSPAVGVFGPAGSRPRCPRGPRARHRRRAHSGGHLLLDRKELPGHQRHCPFSLPRLGQAL